MSETQFYFVMDLADRLEYIRKKPMVELHEVHHTFVFARACADRF